MKLKNLLEEIVRDLIAEKKLCPKGRAYYDRRRAAGEVPSAYLSGRAVQVCKGRIKEDDDSDLDESLRDWFKKEDWVRIDTAGNITGPCGTMKKGKATTRCLPRAKANSLSKEERASTSRKKARADKQGKRVVPNTKKAKVRLREDLSQTKIVDENNKPLIVYRSQEDDRIQGVDRQSDTKGIYFSANADSTKIYGPITKKYHLNIKNPLILKDKEWNLSILPSYYYDMLVKKGYDGAVWLRQGEMYEIIAFYPDQIVPVSEKLDEQDLSILKQIATGVEDELKKATSNGQTNEVVLTSIALAASLPGIVNVIAKITKTLLQKSGINLSKKESVLSYIIRVSGQIDSYLDAPINLALKPFISDNVKREKLASGLKAFAIISLGIAGGIDINKIGKISNIVTYIAPEIGEKLLKARGVEVAKVLKDYVTSVISEEDLTMEEEEIDEYDVELSEEIKDFTQFIKEYVKQLSESELTEAEYRGRKVPLGKPMQGDVKKFKVYVKNPAGRVVKVNFGDPNMRIKKSNPERRKSFRARHNCANPGPRTKARYWSCRKW